MRVFLERWEQLYNELRRMIETERLEHDAQVSSLQLTVSKLETALATQSDPFEKEIQALQSQIRLRESQTKDVNQTIENAITRLAPIVEINPKAPGVTLDAVVTQIILFMDEAKRQFRESL